MTVRAWIGAAAGSAVLCGASDAAADDPAPAAPPREAAPLPPAPAASAPRAIPPVRLAVSAAAAEYFTERRLRRLLEIELEGAAALAASPTGPLDERSVRVWVDLPSPTIALIQVHAPAKRVFQRKLDISSLSWDVAAHIVAIAASESVQAQLRPPPKKQRPPPLTPEQIEARDRELLSVVLHAAGGVAYIPEAETAMGGVHIALGIHGSNLVAELGASWLSGDGALGTLRWFDLGAAGRYRLYPGGPLRVSLGARAAFASVHLSEPQLVDRAYFDADEWSARAGGLVTIEARVAERTYLALELDPAAILRTGPSTAGEESSLAGVWLGASLGVTFNRLLR